MSSRIWIGLLLVIFGVGFLLQQANMLNFVDVLSMWWPAAFIIIGIVQFLNWSYNSLVSGSLFILIGILLLINQWTDLNLWTYVWPLILIFAGITFLFSRTGLDKQSNNDQYIHSLSLFSGVNIKSQSMEFLGGSISTIFSGAKVDIRDVMIAGGRATMDLTSVFGGITIIVPENVQLEISGIPLFGGWDNKTHTPAMSDTSNSVLKIKCFTFCGGIEIKN